MSSLDTSLFLAEVAFRTSAEQSFGLIERFRGKSLYVAHSGGAVRLKTSTLAGLVGNDAALQLSACFPDRVFEFPHNTPLHAYIAALLGGGEKSPSHIAGMLQCTRSHVTGVRQALLNEIKLLPAVPGVRKRLHLYPYGFTPFDGASTP